METKRWWMGATAVATVAALTSLASAQTSSTSRAGHTAGREARSQSSQQYQGSSAQSENTASNQQRSFSVNEHFTRTVADNCTYEGSLRGNVERIPGQGALAADHFHPDLTLDGSVRCPGGVTRSLGAQTIRADGLTRNQLENMIEERGRIDVQHAGRLCTITPDFAWHDDRIVTGESFSQSCHSAATPTGRGGGAMNQQQRSQDRSR